jgi:hypothetical protein
MPMFAESTQKKPNRHRLHHFSFKNAGQQTMSRRQFHVYNVGIPKTGTTSIASLFRQYKTGHEFMFGETVEHIIAYYHKKIAAETFRKYIRFRDCEGKLEMDSSSFNHYYLDILEEEFPDAKFIFTIRDCYSWMNSYLNMLLRWRKYHQTTQSKIPTWQIEYGRFQFGEFDPDGFSLPQALKLRLPDMLDRFLRCWSEYNGRVLDRLPAERSIVIRTHEISGSLIKLAHFVGVAENRLAADGKHSNYGLGKINLLKFVDRDLLEDRCNHYCGNLMNSLFPEHSLDKFLLF